MILEAGISGKADKGSILDFGQSDIAVGNSFADQVLVHVEIDGRIDGSEDKHQGDKAEDDG